MSHLCPHCVICAINESFVSLIPNPTVTDLLKKCKLPVAQYKAWFIDDLNCDWAFYFIKQYSSSLDENNMVCMYLPESYRLEIDEDRILKYF